MCPTWSSLTLSSPNEERFITTRQGRNSMTLQGQGTAGRRTRYCHKGDRHRWKFMPLLTFADKGIGAKLPPPPSVLQEEGVYCQIGCYLPSMSLSQFLATENRLFLGLFGSVTIGIPEWCAYHLRYGGNKKKLQWTYCYAIPWDSGSLASLSSSLHLLKSSLCLFMMSSVFRCT